MSKLKCWKKHQLGWKDDVGFDKGKLKHNKDLPKQQVMVSEFSDRWAVQKRTFSEYGMTDTYKTLKTGFKNRKDALEFAQKYMKDHDSC